MQIAILLYENVTALDAIGPYEILSRLPGVDFRFVATSLEPKLTDTGRLTLSPTDALDAVPRPDVLLVPGTNQPRGPMRDAAIQDWLRSAHEHTTWTASVCTGSLILATAGILRDRRATSHWLARDTLRRLGAEVVTERVVFDGKIATAAGVSAGIDPALALAARLTDEQSARALQLAIEYDPQPPFDSGSLENAAPDIVPVAGRFVGS